MVFYEACEEESKNELAAATSDITRHSDLVEDIRAEVVDL